MQLLLMTVHETMVGT